MSWFSRTKEKWSHITSGDAHELSRFVNRLIEQNDEAGLRALLCTEPDLAEFADLHGFTPLMHACTEGRSSIAKLLLEQGGNANACNESKETPLHMAAAFGHSQIVLMLLAADANPELRTSKGLTAAELAVEVGQSHIISLLPQEMSDLVPARVPSRERYEETHSPASTIVAAVPRQHSCGSPAPPGRAAAQHVREAAYSLLDANLDELVREEREELEIVLRMVLERLEGGDVTHSGLSPEGQR